MKIKPNIKLLSFIIILILLVLTTFVSAEVNHYYRLELAYQKGNLSLQKFFIEPSIDKLVTPEGKYVAEVVSFDNEILNFTFFAIPLTIFYDFVDPETGEITGGGMKVLNETEVALYVPYYDYAKEINIYDPDLNLKAAIDVSSRTRDLASLEKAILLEEKEERPEEAAAKEKLKEEKLASRIILGAGIIILFALIIIFLRKIKRKNI